MGGAVFGAAMPVPEAAVDENDGFVFGQDDIGTAGKIPGVKAETETEPVEQGANAHFGGGVLAANAAHVPGTALFCEPVFVHEGILWRKWRERKGIEDSAAGCRRKRAGSPFHPF